MVRRLRPRYNQVTSYCLRVVDITVHDLHIFLLFIMLLFCHGEDRRLDESGLLFAL